MTNLSNFNCFRDALNNLIFIDLYENAALAHDLKGKFNNCYVYIRSTPRERIMVANPAIEGILNRFGIVSASCKVVGRRNPYAMVRATFEALQKHTNLDEIAKIRGKRYLTLKYMQDHGI
jgi:small subunit ribosomal protein S5